MAEVKPLVFVKKRIFFSVPPVPHGTAEDWKKYQIVDCEPLVLDFLGTTWTATGERNAKGELLYQQGAK